MDDFLRYFAQDIGRIFHAFLNIFKSIFSFFGSMFNIGARMDALEGNGASFNLLEWILFIVANLLLLGIIVVAIVFAVIYGKKLFRFRVPVKKYEEMEKKVRELQRELLKSNYEKDRILSITLGDAEVPEENEGGELVNTQRNTVDSPCVDPSTSRFFRLTSVDNFYKTKYQAPEYDQNITLSEFCERFRAFAAAELHLYYDLKLIRHFIASLGTARIIILQGISGTGKTSLPYAFGKFVNNDSTVVSVQPAWRERTELYGYFNEFTSKYTETEFLRSVYEANYFRDPNLIILDEMNIARVEYYFAEMLSILEMPIQTEWKIDIATAVWDNDPCLINEGKVSIPNNIWFIGTINNDDSTFAVADKVYDRAIPIDLDSRAEAFEIESEGSIHISTDRINQLFDEAKANYGVSDEVMEKLEMMNEYLIKNFRLAFGNRIMKQLRDYVPCFIACGGTELEAVDFVVAKKVLRKFESLSLDFMKDELSNFIIYLDKMFGKSNMTICKEYIAYLRRSN